MDKARLIEILTREHKKLEEGGVEWLREYGANAKRDVGFTFYMICRVLAQSTQDKMLSTDLQSQVTEYMIANGVHFTKKWNPIDWFTSRWTVSEIRKTEVVPSINSETDFDSEYTQIIKRDMTSITTANVAGSAVRSRRPGVFWIGKRSIDGAQGGTTGDRRVHIDGAR